MKDIEIIKEVKKIKLEDGDILIFEIDSDCPLEEFKRIREGIGSEFSNNKYLVLNKVKLSAVICDREKDNSNE